MNGLAVYNDDNGSTYVYSLDAGHVWVFGERLAGVDATKLASETPATYEHMFRFYGAKPSNAAFLEAFFEAVED